MRPELKQFTADLVQSVKTYVARSLLPITGRLGTVEDTSEDLRRTVRSLATRIARLERANDAE